MHCVNVSNAIDNWLSLYRKRIIMEDLFTHLKHDVK